jgi:hypothetical protein
MVGQMEGHLVVEERGAAMEHRRVVCLEDRLEGYLVVRLGGRLVQVGHRANVVATASEVEEDRSPVMSVLGSASRVSVLVRVAVADDGGIERIRQVPNLVDKGSVVARSRVRGRRYRVLASGMPSGMRVVER